MTTADHDPLRPVGRRAYKLGCRCTGCCAIQLDYGRAWQKANRAKLNAQSRARKARATAYEKTREPIEQRLAYGWTVTRIMHVLDVDDATVKTVRDGLEAAHQAGAA